MPARSAMILAAALLLPSAAIAQGAGARAVVEGGKAGRVVADGALWNCGSGACTGTSRGGRYGDARACGDLAARASRIIAFTGAGGEMPAEALADCNKRARSAK